MRLGVFGGSFNPVHAGHAALGRAALAEGRFDELLLIPDNLPPHKPADALASNEDRARMLELAFADVPRARVSRIEYELGGKSYTIRTLRLLQERAPGTALTLVLGADMLYQFRSWRDWEEILALAELLAAPRRRDEFAALEECRAGFGPLAGRIRLLRHPAVEISSTELRARLAAGEDPGPLLPPGVADYIRARGLYREGAGEAGQAGKEGSPYERS